jgi:hypothetical protein
VVLTAGIIDKSIFDLAQLNQFLQISPIFLNLTNFYKLVILLGDYLDRLQLFMANYGVIQPSESRSPAQSSHLRTLLATDSGDDEIFELFSVYLLHWDCDRVVFVNVLT